jgi:hypothetical protein
MALTATVPIIAVSAQGRAQLGALNGNEGIYVSRTNFGIVKGSPKTDPTAQIMKLGAQEVNEGAIIMRVGDKLYLVDVDPNGKSLYSGWAEDAFSGATP